MQNDSKQEAENRATWMAVLAVFFDHGFEMMGLDPLSPEACSKLEDAGVEAWMSAARMAHQVTGLGANGYVPSEVTRAGVLAFFRGRCFAKAALIAAKANDAVSGEVRP